jgi:hypothetical protein
MQYKQVKELCDSLCTNAMGGMTQTKNLKNTKRFRRKI